MTRRRARLSMHFDASWWWIGVCVLERWIVVQPVPCIGVTWRRRYRGPIHSVEHGGTWHPAHG